MTTANPITGQEPVVKLNTLMYSSASPAEVLSVIGLALDDRQLPKGFLYFARVQIMATLPLDEQIRRNEMFAKGFLWCSECKQFKPKDCFYKARTYSQNAPFGYRRHCIECNRKRRDPVAQKKAQKERNYNLKRQFVELAGSRCQRCGYNEFVTGFDFHHVYPSEKEKDANTLIYSNNFEETWRELDKCCLLCGNCHSAYTGGEWRAEFIKREGLGWTVGQSLPLDDDRYNQKPDHAQQSPLPPLPKPKWMLKYEQRLCDLRNEAANIQRKEALASPAKAVGLILSLDEKWVNPHSRDYFNQAS